MLFSSLNLSSELNLALKKNNFTKPTPIQEKVIPQIFLKQDIMAKAKTGTGKSASYILPILDMITKSRDSKKAKIKVLVLTPTRELTLQISQTFRDFGSYMQIKPKVVSVIGGEEIGGQLYDIQKGCDILVATSGRFIDILSKKQMNLSNLDFFVLDEADKMLNFGFGEELKEILDAIPKDRQNLLFSATYPDKILNLCEKITQNPMEISIEEEVATVDTVKQIAIEVDRHNRGSALRHILKKYKFGQVLVFMANKRATDNIADKFIKKGYKAESFHGDLTQEERNKTLNDFKTNKINILFATDIIARGLDLENIECVVNFDLPRSPTDYIHRIGRTARAGRVGTAISFISQEDMAHFKIIEKKCKISVEKEQIIGLELKEQIIQKVRGKAPIKGKRKSKKDKLREAEKNQDL